MKNEIDNNSEIIKKLNILKSTPDRDPAYIKLGRSAFLAQASKIGADVSPEAIKRHKNWNQKHPINLIARRKEHVPMLSTITSIILAISLLLGGSGATVAAAQASEPGDLLYNIKLLSENAALNLTANPESQFELALNLVDRRANEILSILGQGDLVADETIIRYRDQIEQAMFLAMNLTEDEILPAFEKVQNRLNTQQQTLTQLKTNGTAEAIAIMTQTRDMIQERLRILEEDQLQVMEQQRIQEQLNNPESGNSPTNFGESTQNTPYTGGSTTIHTETPSNNPGNGQGNQTFWQTSTPFPISTTNGSDGQNNPSGPSSPQENQETTTPNSDPQHQGTNSGSGSPNGNH